MRILITGGAGFMGSNFIHYLLEKYPDYQIVNLDKLTYAGNLENLKDVEDNPNYTFIKGDIAVKEDVKKALGLGADVIVNYAAETHVDRSIMDPEAFIKTDVLGTFELLEAVKDGQAQKMIQISTDEVFGEIKEGEFSEDSPFLPNSPYSASKAGGDLMCRAYFKTYQTPVIVTHSCNFYGAYQYPEKLIPLFVTNLLEGKKVPMYGDGKNVREWIFTKDHCRAIDVILHKGEAGEVYNIGSGDQRENLEIAEMLFDILGLGKEKLEYVKDRPGHDWRYAINSDRLRQKLGWKPEYKLEEGLKETVEWYKNNKDWWQKLKDGKYLDYYKRQYGK
ncbi:MAG: dTDP-glucose 4,6-dehydratase [Patescibacteria group bacterium]|nr:dTDP-glucose 4,6-dehydratase [Patescibacteria group bacterium]